MTAAGEVARQDDVRVEQRSRRIRDRIGEVVALDEDRVERGDRSGAGARCDALEEARHVREHARRIAFGRGWFAKGKADLPGRHREPGQRIDHEEDVLAAVAKVFGDRRGRRSAAQPLERRTVRSCGDDDHLAAALRAHELDDFTTALADQADHDHVGVGLARDLFDEHALAAPGAGEDADALAATTGQQAVDHAYAGVEALAHAAALIDRQRAGIERNLVGAARLRPTIHR